MATRNKLYFRVVLGRHQMACKRENFTVYRKTQDICHTAEAELYYGPVTVGGKMKLDP